MRALQFLMKVWGYSCDKGDFVFLSTKDPGNDDWKDHCFEYGTGLRSKIKDFLSNYPSAEYDIYFCPLPFLGRRRAKNLVRHTNILWSDIDEGNPNKIKPTLLWESSPGRLQGIWFLEGKKIHPEDLSDLNKQLTYYIDADKGGWDLTQVLRVPGTKNHKYQSLPSVRLLEFNDEKVYNVRRLKKRIGANDPVEEVSIGSNKSFEQIFSKYKRQIPAKVKHLLLKKSATQGKRSDILWYLENKLSEVGLSPPEIITLVSNSVWNKFKGRADENIRLKSEMQKVVEDKALEPQREIIREQVDEELFDGFNIESYTDVMSSLDSAPGWLIEGFWMKESHGIVAGEPKSFKSTLILDMAVAVASGKPFLNKYKVEGAGPVVYIQNENSKWIMKDRLEKIAMNKGLIGEVELDDPIKVEWAPDFPLYMINQQSCLLTDPLHQKLIEKTIEKYKPKLIILDPLYLMFDGDINSSKELNPILSWLLEIRFKYRCGVILIHHWNKGGNQHNSGRGGQKMMGSGTLHGWIESAWYIKVDGDKDIVDDPDISEDDVNKVLAKAGVTIEREFRGGGMHPRVDVEIEMGEIGDPHYQVEVKLHKEKEKEGEHKTNREEGILKHLELHPKGIKEGALLSHFGGSRTLFNEMIDSLCDKGLVKRINPGKIILVDKEKEK